MTSIEQSYGEHRLYPRLAILAAGLFVVATNAFVIAGLLPSIASTLGVQPSNVSYSITYYSIVVAIAAPVIAVVFPRMSRTTLMATGMALVAVGTAVSASAGDLTLFTVGRVVAALGGAALVPAATAAAASLASPARRGRAIAFVAIGFTAASAFGAPLGTVLATAGSWRLPLVSLAALAAVVAVAIALAVRRIPVGDPVSMRRRFGVLRDPRVLFALLAGGLLVTGFNVVYIFSSAVTKPTTGGSGAVLAILLLVFGVSGIIGTVVAGPATDRYGNRALAAVAFGLQLVVLAAIPLVGQSLLVTAIVFGLWGVAVNASLLPIQHRLIEIDPATAGVALSWYSTAMYLGIALAPPLGAAAIALGNAELIPVFGAAAIAIALAVFQLGYLRRYRSAPYTDLTRSAAVSSSS